jgi:23S rRNA pseudouridine2605 synthase
MLEAVGHPVLKLTRVRFGPLNVGGLPRGEARYLTDPEILRLKEAAGLEDASVARRPFAGKRIAS